MRSTEAVGDSAGPGQVQAELNELRRQAQACIAEMDRLAKRLEDLSQRVEESADNRSPV